MKTDKTGSVQSVLAVGSYPDVVPSETAGDTGVWPGRIAHVADVEAALAEIAQTHPRLVLVLEDCDCEDIPRLVQRVRAVSPASAVVVVRRKTTVAEAVKCMRAGAMDYLCGPLDEDAFYGLMQCVRGGHSSGEPREELFCQACPPGVEIVGRSRGMAACLETVRRIAQSSCNPVLILGETGTGKELIAQAVHVMRHGESGPFVAVNCATLTANLLESELFGHVKGAFTGADRDKKGLFEVAAGGSIFLDEISEMPMELQAKLLRVLQERTFRKVGGTTDISCEATIIVSSNRDLLEEARAKRFREDLYYRLAVFPIVVPPLRHVDRRSDIGLLAEYFLQSTGVVNTASPPKLGSEAAGLLQQHDWPGNVRELRNVIARAMIIEPTAEISASSVIFDQHVHTLNPAELVQPQAMGRDFSLEAAEREFIRRALQETGWQRTKAAALLGITRATLHAKLKRYDINPPDKSFPPAAVVEDSSESLAARSF